MLCPNCHAENTDDSRFCSNRAAPPFQAISHVPGIASIRKSSNQPIEARCGFTMFPSFVSLAG